MEAELILTVAGATISVDCYGYGILPSENIKYYVFIHHKNPLIFILLHFHYDCKICFQFKDQPTQFLRLTV